MPHLTRLPVQLQQMVVIWEVKPSGFRFFRRCQIQIFNEKSPGLNMLAQWFFWIPCRPDKIYLSAELGLLVAS